MFFNVRNNIFVNNNFMMMPLMPRHYHFGCNNFYTYPQNSNIAFGLLTAGMTSGVMPTFQMPIFGMQQLAMPQYGGFQYQMPDFSTLYKQQMEIINNMPKTDYTREFTYDNENLKTEVKSSSKNNSVSESLTSTGTSSKTSTKQDIDGLSTDNRGFSLIKEFEGCRLSAYKCSSNVFTIGYGHTSGVSAGQKITQQQAESYLKSDIKTFERTVKSLVKVPLSQNQFDALVSFAYNVGPRNFAESTLLKKLNNGDYQGAANEFMQWTKADGKHLKGLERRRETEKELFLA